MHQHCNICLDDQLTLLYAGDHVSVTSINTHQEQQTRAWFCQACGHLMSDPVVNIEAFYESSYAINAHSEEEDQLLKVVGEQKIYRSDYQAETFLQKNTLQKGMKILDYGGAKGATIKKVYAASPKIEPFIFDVSPDYLPFWENIFPENQYALKKIPESWHDSFDIVSSFFVLEHIPDITGTLQHMHSLLKEGGILYFVIPNLYENMADLLVMDHVNHFSVPSLKTILSKTGFTAVSIDERINPGWFVVQAQKGKEKGIYSSDPRAVQDVFQKAKRIADLWTQATLNLKKLASFNGKKTAIYGAGFYGTFIRGQLSQEIEVSYFIDQNPFLQGRDHLGLPVKRPAEVPGDVTDIIVGLNPLIARSAIQNIAEFKDRAFTYHFLFEHQI